MSRKKPVPGDVAAPSIERAGSARWLTWVAIAASVAAIALRVLAALAAGPLWRDEAGSASTATVPTLAEFWARQHLDSFPLLWQLLLRAWSTVWGGGDASIRTLGLLVAVLLIAALWWASRCFRVVPLASLLFAGVAPTFVVWAGVQNRAYGLGSVLLALLIGAVWLMVQAPGAGTVALAALLALLAVHTTYHLPVMLAALLGAATVVGLRRRSWAIVAASAGIGATAAASLLVYAGVLARTRVLAKMVYAKDLGLTGVASGLDLALAPGGRFVVYAFAVATIAACAWGWATALRAAPPRTDADAADAVVFAGAAATLAVLGQIAFLLYLRFLVQPWYYVTVVLLVAVAVDVVLQRGVPLRPLRDALAGALAVLIAASTFVAVGTADRRQSNLDLVAAYLKANARPGDLIVVYPWHYGVSFSRYYDGTVPFMTVPAVEGHDYHRFDQLAALMEKPESIQPGFRRIHQTLESGGRVWVVGRLAGEVPPVFPLLPPPRDEDPASWRDGTYTAVAGLQLAWVLAQSSPEAQPVPPLTDARVSDYEDAPVTLYAKRPR